jgi:hypothetical protein
MRGALLILAVALLAAPARAAHLFLAEDGSGTVISLEGRIEPGDADRFERFMRGAGPRIATLRLRSPGGRAAEAMKIGALVRGYLLATEAPVDEGGLAVCADGSRDCVCASACVFVWVAGIHRNERAHLEAHRPAQPDGSEPDAPAESEAALRRYFEALETPPALADLVLATPSDRLALVPARLIRQASGFVPSIERILAERCPAPRQPACERRVLKEMRRLAREKPREAPG